MHRSPFPPVLLPLLGMLAAAGKANGRPRGAIYARYSTRFQHSIEDQVRQCREWAETNGVEVRDEHIFADRATTGRTHRRAGLKGIIEALSRDEVDVVISFATNRLYRKVYRALAFVEEEVVDRRKRAVFVMQNIDTTQKDFWRQLITFAAMIDEWQSQMNVDFIRSAQEGLLLQELVHGTITYGYRGERVEGQATRNGKPRQRWDICPDTSPWVRKMFAWYVERELSLSAIARRLNREGAPSPPRSPRKSWTAAAVRNALGNRRYVGDWSYGRTESIWQNRAGYSRQVERSEPRRSHRIERLRLIDDAMFLRAQERLAQYQGRGGRRKGSGRNDVGPNPLHRLFWCSVHERYMIAASDRVMQCPECKASDKPHLYSLFPRTLGLRLLCTEVARLIQADEQMIGLIVQACREHMEALAKPEDDEVAALERRAAELSARIGFILRQPGETETDRAENEAVLREARAERAGLDRRLHEHRTWREFPPEVPSEEEVRHMLADLQRILLDAAEGDDVEKLAAARQVLHQVTGGRIVMSQQGERQPKRGWLRGTFHLNLLAPLLAQKDIPAESAAEDGHEVAIDFKEPELHEQIADEAKQLLDQDDPALEIQEIAAELSRRHKTKIHRNTVTKALRHWHESRGLPAPDFRRRRAAIGNLKLNLALYNDPKIVAQVMERFERDLLYGQIADEVGVNRATVTKIVSEWHHNRGLPVPDGRTRRKALGQRSHS